MSSDNPHHFGGKVETAVGDDLQLHKGLAENTLGLWSSVNLGIASTAPAYSLAATIGFVVIAVGVQAPIVMLLAFVPMWFTAIAYRELNSEIPDCGTTFTWGAKTFGPKTGWMGGWGVAIAGVMFMSSAAAVCASYFYYLIGLPELTSNRFVMLVTGTLFIIAMSYVTYRGIEGSAKLQYGLVGLQMVSLLLLSGVSLFTVLTGGGTDVSLMPSLDWFNPFGIESWSAFMQGFLLCLFIYWGFDTTLALTEETEDSTVTPGRAAIISTVLLMLLYTFVTVSALSYLGVDLLSDETNANDIFAVWAEPVLGVVGTKLLAFTVLVSTMSSMMTTILPTARGTLAMAVYQAIPARFAVVSPKFLTPSFSTIVIGVTATGIFIGLSLISQNVLEDAVASTAIAVAFYYGLTAYSAVWLFRKESLRGGPGFKAWWSLFWPRFLAPLLGAIILTFALVQTAIDSLDPDYGYTTIFGIGSVFVIGIGSLILGVVMMLVCMTVFRGYFAGETLRPETPVLVPDE